MTLLPPLRPREVITALETLGFERVRQHGSHAIFHHPDGRRATLPVHPTQEISRYLLADVLRHLQVEETVFLRVLHRGAQPPGAGQ